MEIIKVDVCMEDRDYGLALAKALAGISRSFQVYMDAPGSGADLILCDREQKQEQVQEQDQERTVLFTEREEDADIDGRILWRYQKAGKTADDLIYIYYKLTGRIAEYRGNRGFRLIVFAQAEGGCGATSLAVSVGRCLNAMGRKCLYINMSPLDDSLKYFGTEKSGQLVRLLYHLKKDDDFPVHPFIQEGELDRIPAPVHNIYTDEIDPAAAHRLLSLLEHYGRYDYVITDIGTHWTRTNMGLVSSSDCTAAVRRAGAGRDRFTPAALSLLREQAGRSVTVANFAGDDPGSIREGEIPVSSEPEAFIAMNGQIRIDLRHSYGMDAVALAKRLEEECVVRKREAVYNE